MSERLGGSSVDTHVHGVPDWVPPAELGVTVHGGWSGEARDPWFVAFDPRRQAALVAIETARGLGGLLDVRSGDGEPYHPLHQTRTAGPLKRISVTPLTET